MPHDAETLAGMDRIMRQVVDELKARGLLPLILIAGNEDERAILPCAPCQEETVWGLLRDIVAAHDATPPVSDLLAALEAQEAAVLHRQDCPRCGADLRGNTWDCHEYLRLKGVATSLRRSALARALERSEGSPGRAREGGAL